MNDGLRETSIDPSPTYNTGAWLRDLSDETIDLLIRYDVSDNGSSPLTVTEVRHAGRAIARPDRQAAAYSHRDAELLLGIIAFTPTPEVYRHATACAEQLKRDLRPHLTGGIYLNYLDVQEARALTRDAYTPEAYRDLRTLKARYDPANLFNHSFDVPPEARAA